MGDTLLFLAGETPSKPGLLVALSCPHMHGSSTLHHHLHPLLTSRQEPEVIDRCGRMGQLHLMRDGR